MVCEEEGDTFSAYYLLPGTREDLRADTRLTGASRHGRMA